MLAEIGKLLESPYTSLIAALILGGIALSGKFSVTATQILLVVAFLVGVVALREQPFPILIGGAAIIGGVLVILGYWFRPDALPAYVGSLKPPKPTLIFGPSKAFPRIQIGRSGVYIASVCP